MMSTVDVFADVGILAHDEGVLPDALLELSVRLDLKGAGPLLDLLIGTCFAPNHEGACPRCGKQDPGKPHPKPPSPPPPPKPPQPKDMCRCPACIASKHPQSDGSCGCPSCISGRPT